MAGTPRHPELVGHDWQVTISTICIEAGHSRNALYDGHPELLREIRTTIAKQRQLAVQTAGERQSATGFGLELAACRADQQRLISENAALLLRAITAEEALARLRLRAPRPLKMNVLQAGSPMALAGHAQL
jgi:hypothetical protein